MKDHWNELITTALGDRAMWVHHSTEVLKSDNFSVEFHGNKKKQLFRKMKFADQRIHHAEMLVLARDGN